MQPSATRLIFVYGTLMEGEGNWSWALAPRRPITWAITPQGFQLLHLGGFPGMVRAASGEVHGEVFQVEESEIPKLDRLEGHPHFYRREAIEVFSHGDDVVRIPVETYIYQGAAQGRGPIPSGSWRERSLSL